MTKGRTLRKHSLLVKAHTRPGVPVDRMAKPRHVEYAPRMLRFFDHLRLRLGLPAVTTALLVVTTAVYLVQGICSMLLGLSLPAWLGLSSGGFMQGQYWQFLTYQFLHGGPLHLLFNMLMLGFLGAEVERSVGRRHFLVLYLLSGLLGGAGWLALTYPQEGVCVGASGAIFGLLSAFAVLFPRREVTFLLFFVLPLTMRAWVMAALLALGQLVFMVSPGWGGIAYTAHLAGALVGFAYAVAVFRPEAGLLLRQSWRAHRAERAQARRREETQDIDRILDKVAREGIHTLSRAERAELDRASRTLRETKR